MKRALKIFCIILAFASLNYSPAFSATGVIRGKVSEKGGQAIAGATVRILEIDRATHTGADGLFAFPSVPAGTYHVFVNSLGYASVTNSVQVTANGIIEMTIEMRQSALPSEEVVISASPYARAESDQYQAVASKDAIELHQSPGSSFAEEIEDLPGVSVRWNGSAPARPMLRGLTDNDVLVIENGLRTGDLSTFDPAHAVPIEPEGVQEVDVVRGPASLMYGPNAVGGLVNVITDLIPNASSKTVSGKASVMGNSVSDLYSGYFSTTISDGSSAFKFSAGGLHSQDIKIPSGIYSDAGTPDVNGNPQVFQLSKIPQSFDHTSEEGVGYSYTGDFGMTGVGAKHYAMNYGIPGDPWDSTYMNPSISRIEMEKYTFELKGLFNIGGSFVDQIRLNSSATDYIHSEHPDTPASYFPSEMEQNNFHQNEYNTTLQFLLQKMGNWQGTIGIWTDIDNLNIGGLQPLGPNSLTTDYAAYIYEEYFASENTRIQGALRYDMNKISTFAAPNSTVPEFVNFDQTRDASALTGSVGIVQKLSSELTGSFSVGRSFRAPTLQELFSKGPDDASQSSLLGDSTLVPETGLEIDASLKGHFNSFSFEVSPFLNLIQNYLYSYGTGVMDSVNDPSYEYRQFAQADARLMGFEASASVQLMDNWAVTASASYVNASIINDSTTPLPFIPPLKGLVRLNYEGSMFSGMIEWRLAAPQYNLGAGDDSVKGYGVVNLGVGMKISSGSMTHYIGVHCDNLLNQPYRDNLSVLHDFLPQPARGFRLTYDGLF